MIVTGWRQTTSPTFQPVDLALLKWQVNVTHDEDDNILTHYIDAATAWVERYCGRALATQSYTFTLSEWVPSCQLPYAAPLQSITSVKYYDAANVQQTWAAANYRAVPSLQPAGLEIDVDASMPSLYSREDAVAVEYVVGWAFGLTPAPLVQAVLMLAAHWYAHRESVVVGMMSREIEFGVKALCDLYRVQWSEPC